MAKRRYRVTFTDGRVQEIGADSTAQVRRVYGDKVKSVELVEDYTKGAKPGRASRTMHTDREIW